jgi:hypothetical protein
LRWGRGRWPGRKSAPVRIRLDDSHYEVCGSPGTVLVGVVVVGFGDDVSVVGVSVGLGGGLLVGVGVAVAAGCTVMLAQPSDTGAGPGGPALSADTHTRWPPGAAGIEAPKPWLPATL